MKDDESSPTRNPRTADIPARNAPPESPPWYRVLGDASSSPVVVLDFDWRVMYANAAAAHILGVPASSATGQQLRDLVPALRNSPLQEGFQRVMNARTSTTVTHELTQDGKPTRWLEARLFPVPEGLLVLGADVTQRQHTAQALRDSEARFRNLFDNALNAIIVVSGDGAIQEVNQVWLDMFQYSRDDLTSLNVAEDLYADPELRGRILQQAAEYGTVSSMVKYKRKDGTVFDARLRVIKLPDAGGNAELYQGFIYDTTELVQAESRERDQRGFAAALMETSPACILVFDTDRRIVFANVEADRVLGIPHEKLLGMTCGLDFLLLDLRGAPLPEDRLPACHVLKTQEPIYGVEYAFDSPSGRRILSISAAPLHSENLAVSSVVASIEDVTARRQMEEDLWRSYDTRASLNEILELSLADLPLQSILERSLIHILSIPWFSFESTGAIFLVEDQPDTLVMKAQLGLAESVQEQCGRLEFGRCLCGRAALTKEPQFADNVESTQEIVSQGLPPHGHYCIPILFDDVVRGVVSVYTKEGHPRDAGAVTYLSAVANTLAGIIERRRREHEREEALARVQTALTATVQVMSAAVEMRDPYTAGHQLRVTIVARAIAEEMGMSAESLRAVEVAGRVHDLGKLRIPAEILTKPSKLTAVEYQLIKEHPQASYELLKGVDFPWPVAEIAREHHERIDGSGYPQGLKGDEMLPEARVLAVADVFEAMSSHRPYRPTLGTEAALQELESHSGVLYDSLAVEALVRLVREKGFAVEG